ncbi:MAG TPA: hypothetical protein P5191_11145 [Ruminococcus sp.]|nr:hypothetical protein [Ruminococcus sp.]
MDKSIFSITVFAVAAIMGLYYFTRKNRMRSLLYGSLTGLTALILLSHFGEKIGLDLGMNIFNCCGSLLLGVPFVICEVILKFL